MRKLIDKLLNFLIVLFGIIIVLSLTIIFVFYNPSLITEHVKPKEDKGVVIKREEGPSGKEVSDYAEIDESEEDNLLIPEEVKKRVKELGRIVSDYIVYLKAGIESKPGLIFKVLTTETGVTLYVLTYYPLEWPFTKVYLGSYGTYSPDKVFLCEKGLIALELSLKGLFPPEVPKGEIEDYGALLYYSDRKFELSVFKDGECEKNGFVFNLAGEFSGVCFGGEFISSQLLYNELPESCKIIYQKEGKDGDLQG